MIRNKYIALAYRVFCFGFTLVGLLIHMDIANGSISLRRFMYYTTQSNLLALALFGFLSVKTAIGIRRDGGRGDAGYLPRFEMVCVVDLLLTLVVYWALLAPGSFSMGLKLGIWSFGNMAVHLFVPLMCLADYFLFTKPGRLKYRDVYYVLAYPLFYVLFSTAAGLSGYVYRLSSIDGSPVRFPYFFFDWDVMGAKALVYIAALVLFFLVLSHLLYWQDTRRARKGRKIESF